MSSAQQRIRGRSLRKRVAIGVLAAVMVSPALVACGSDSGITINVYYGPEENFQSVVDNCNAKAAQENPPYKIVYNKLPRDADGQRQQMVRRLAAGDAALDVLGLDVTWVPEFAKAGWLKPWTGQDEAEAKADVIQGPLATATYDNKLYAATKNTNVQLLWYDDRLTPQPPATFDEMITKAQDLKKQGNPRYQILFTGAQYEGLVVFYNTLTASSNGHILSDDGSKVVMDQGAVSALGLLKRIASSGVTSPALTSAQEQQVQLGFQNVDGAGAFELNWPFVYSSMQSEAKKPGASQAVKDAAQHFKWARYPSAVPGTPSKVTIGGYNLAVSTYSPHPEQSFKAALCLRNKDNQKFSAIKDGVPPTLRSLYTDETPLDASKPANADDNPSMATAYPMKADILSAVEESAVRPLSPIYQNASTVTSKLLSPPQDIDPQGTANELREQLQLALDSKGVLP
jgi:trehalose/maltose transport system substrate-binding protein